MRHPPRSVGVSIAPSQTQCLRGNPGIARLRRCARRLAHPERHCMGMPTASTDRRAGLVWAAVGWDRGDGREGLPAAKTL